MQIHCSTRSGILSMVATQYTGSLNGISHPHWPVQWSHHCSHMLIPVHSPWLPGYINVMQIVLVILAMAGLFSDRPCNIIIYQVLCLKMITTKNRTFCAWMINSKVKFIYLKYLLKVFIPIYDLPCENFYFQTSWFMQPRVYLRHCGFFSYFNSVFIFTVCGMGIINTDFYFHFL